MVHRAILLAHVFFAVAFARPAQADLLVGWGDNSFGQTNVPAGSQYTAISAGEFWGFALTSNGSIVGWGYNLKPEFETVFRRKSSDNQ